MMPTLSAASSVLITHPSFFSMERCPSAKLRIRRHNLGINAFGQVHRVDAGGLRELFEQTVETVLVHGVVLHAFRFFRYLCDQSLQLFRRLCAFEVLDWGEPAANTTVCHDGGSRGPDRAAEHSRRGH